MEAKDHNTLISLREYVDIRFDAQEKAVGAALAAADRAVGKAELASEKRFESMNEFRGALADSARLLMPRAEAEQLIKALTIKTDALEARTNSRDDRGSGQAEGWTKIGLAVSIVANFVMIFVYLTRGHG